MFVLQPVCTQEILKKYSKSMTAAKEIMFSFVSVRWFVGRITKKNYGTDFHNTRFQNSLTFVTDLDKETNQGSFLTGQILTLIIVGQPDIPSPSLRHNNQLLITNLTFKSGTI